MNTILKGLKIQIRLISRDTIPTLLCLANDISTMGDHWPLNEIKSEESFLERFNRDGYFGETSGRVLITDHSSRIVGILVYFKPDNFSQTLEIGYRIFSLADQNKGYTTEALRLFSSFLFESRPIARIQVTTDPNNLPANAVAKSAGFTMEGCIRQAIFIRGKMRDQNIWSILRNEAGPLTELMPT